jgi:HAD superfamily hydrolase (TIGR01450 family)
MRFSPKLHHDAELRVQQARAKLEDAHGFVIDLDGTLIAGTRLLHGARPLLEYAEGRYAIVSNNSSDTSVSLARKLARLGLPVEPDRIVLASEQTVLLIAQRYPQARIRVVAHPALVRFAAESGCDLVEENPDVILLGRDPRFSYAKLRSMVNQMRSGARLIVTNPDMNHPAEDGGLTPETGCLMKAVVACSGIEPECIVGKPAPLLFREALNRLGTASEDTLVIGDNPLTDALGAERLLMPYLLVGSHQDALIPSLNVLFGTDGAGRTSSINQ